MNGKEFTEIDISLIETRVPEDVLLKAEDIADSGSVSGLVQLKENSWEAVVIDRNHHFSNHLTIKSNKLFDSKCNCNVHPKEGICGHILALIFHIRKIATKNEKKIKKRKKEKLAKPFNLHDLLKQLTRDELETFVLAKARTDRNFKLLIQARFVEKLKQEQLAPFIESTFQVLTKANEKIAASKLKTFLDITDELFNHFKNLMAHEDLIEAYNLAFLLLKKSFYIKFHLRSEHAVFYKHHNNLLSNYIEVYKLIEAPEYKQNINIQLEELLSTSYMKASLVKERDIWMLYYNSTAKRSKLVTIVEKYLERDQSQDYSSIYFVKMLELILTEDAKKRIESISQKDMQESYRIIQYLCVYKNYTSCQLVMHEFYCTRFLSHPLAKLIIESVDVIPSFHTKLLDQSLAYFIAYKNTVYLSFIQKISPEWKASKLQLITTIKSKGDMATLIKLHLACHDLDEALNVLHEELSWDLVKLYDRDIVDQDVDACYELYYSMMEAYLVDHFGVHAQDFVKMVLSRAERIGYKSWVRPLKKRLEERFKDRKSLF